MELSVFWRSLRQRWYLVLALAVLTASATFLAAQRVGPTYEASGTVLVFPPSQVPGTEEGATTRGNPYLVLGGVNQARDVLVRALTSTSVADAFGEQFPGTGFEIVPDYTNSAPIILFTVESTTPRTATDALGWLVDQVPAALQDLQAGLDIPAAEKVTAVELTRDERPTTTRKDQIRAALLVAAGLGGTGLLLIALVDGLLGARRRGRATDDAGAAPGAPRSTGRGAEPTGPPSHEQPPTPAGARGHPS